MAKATKSSKPVIYRHSSHAEWGLGMIVEETSSKIYLAFENGGRRPFLNVQRYRELLVPEELEAAAAEEVAARITKNTSKPAAKPSQKKPKKKAAAAKPEEEEKAEAAAQEEPEDNEEEDSE